MPTLLEAVREAAQRLAAAEADRDAAYVELERAVRHAVAEGISLSKIEEWSGLGRQRVRTLAGRKP